MVIPSTIGCGSCSYCRSGYFSQCDNANPGGPQAGTAFFGDPEADGGFDGMQAERRCACRSPTWAGQAARRRRRRCGDHAVGHLPDRLLRRRHGGDHPRRHRRGAWRGPVRQFAIWSAFKLAPVIVVDQVPDRLAQAKREGAEVVDFGSEDPTEAITELTRGTGADRVIDAVGVDAEGPEPRPEEVAEVAPEQNPQGEVFKPGQAPSQAADRAVQTVAKAGTISIIGVYSPTAQRYPIGEAMNKNLTL